MLQKHGYIYFHEFFLYHNLYRFTGMSRQHPFKFYYYIPIFLGSLYLWLPFTIEIKDYVKQAIRNKGKEIFFIIWALFPLLFFSISVNKLHNYILISYPAVAIMLADCLSKIEIPGKAVRRFYIAVAIAETCMLILYMPYLKNRSFIIVGVVLILFVSATVIFKGTSIFRISVFTMLKAFCMLLIVIALWKTNNRSLNEAYAITNYEANIERWKIFSYRNQREDFSFYENRYIPYLRNKADLEEVLQRHNKLVLIIKDEDLKDIRDIDQQKITSFDDFLKKETYSIIEINP
jgi:4-amino-4-deoxy-L-arabinose transferase-like glycosyltransferase